VLCPEFEVRVVQMPIVRMQAARNQAGGFSDTTVQPSCFRPWSYAGAMHAAVKVEENFQREIGFLCRFPQFADWFFRVDNRGKSYFRKLAHEPDQSIDRRADG